MYAYRSLVFIDDDFHQALIQIFMFHYSNIIIYFSLNIEKKSLLGKKKQNEVNSFTSTKLKFINEICY